jgi:hypothetical protein
MPSSDIEKEFYSSRWVRVALTVDSGATETDAGAHIVVPENCELESVAVATSGAGAAGDILTVRVRRSAAADALTGAIIAATTLTATGTNPEGACGQKYNAQVDCGEVLIVTAQKTDAGDTFADATATLVFEPLKS